jgi:putative spermidine/putrescine transport system permease protein
VAPGLAVVGLMLVLPVAIVAANSLVTGEPGQIGGWPPTLENFANVLADARTMEILARTVLLAAVATVAACAISYPLAIVIVSTRSRVVRAVFVICALSPLLVSVVLRTFGWQVLLGGGGPVANVLVDLFGPGWLLGLIGTDVAIVLGLTHVLVPFVLLGLLPALDKIDPNVVHAADSLGASRTRIFWRVIVPLSRDGLLAGVVIGLALGMTAYVTPALLGGRERLVFASLVYEQNFVDFDWNAGAALALVLLGAVIIVGFVVTRLGVALTRSRRPRARAAEVPA